jgi:hypothetical protein
MQVVQTAAGGRHLLFASEQSTARGEEQQHLAFVFGVSFLCCCASSLTVLSMGVFMLLA